MLQSRKLLIIAFVVLVVLIALFMLQLQRSFTKTSFLIPLAQHDPVSELEGELRKKNIATSVGPVASDSAIFVLLGRDSTQVLFSEDKDVGTQVSSLQIIFNKLTIEGRKAQKIDLRFDDPVVVY